VLRFDLQLGLLALSEEREACADPDQREHLRFEILSMQRRIALLDAEAGGASLEKPPAGSRLLPQLDGHFRSRFETSPQASMLIDPRAGLHIVEVNAAYAAATMINASRVTGERLFDVFPDNPADKSADGVTNLFDSLKIAAVTLRTDKMAIQRYDVRDASGRFVERYWQPVNQPIADAGGRLRFIMHSAVDVTDLVISKKTDGASASLPCDTPCPVREGPS
jgi:hypothetical protein